MIKFEKIVPGMRLWDVRKTTGLNRFNSKWSTWPVYVSEVDHSNRKVLASWNGNPPTWMSERHVTKLRASLPKSKV